MDFRKIHLMNKTLLVFIILAGLIITACGSQPTEAPASPLTEEPAPAIEAPTDAPSPTDTAVPPTEVPTEEPTAEPVASSGGISFANDIQPLLQSRCKNCHGGDRGTEEGLDMTSYANLMAGSDNGPVIIAGDADGSLLVELLVEQKMPKRGPKLAPPQVQLIIDWVNQGAMDN